METHILMNNHTEIGLDFNWKILKKNAGKRDKDGLKLNYSNKQKPHILMNNHNLSLLKNQPKTLDSFIKNPLDIFTKIIHPSVIENQNYKLNLVCKNANTTNNISYTILGSILRNLWKKEKGWVKVKSLN